MCSQNIPVVLYITEVGTGSESKSAAVSCLIAYRSICHQQVQRTLLKGKSAAVIMGN